MRAYTDKFVVRPDGIYRIERVYHPGGEWEMREVLWISRQALEAAQAIWAADRQTDDRK